LIVAIVLDKLLTRSNLGYQKQERVSDII